MTWDLKKTQMEHGPSTSVRKKARPKTSSLTSLLVSTLLIQPTCLTWLLWYSLSSNSRKKQPKSELPNHIPHFHWKGIDVIPADYSWTPYSYGPSPTWLCEPSCWRSRSPRIEALTLSVAGFVNKKLSHSWIIVEHQVKVQKKTHGYDMLFSCSISWSSSFEAKKTHRVFALIPCFKIDFPSILPSRPIRSFLVTDSVVSFAKASYAVWAPCDQGFRHWVP